MASCDEQSFWEEHLPPPTSQSAQTKAPRKWTGRMAASRIFQALDFLHKSASTSDAPTDTPPATAPQSSPFADMHADVLRKIFDALIQEESSVLHPFDPFDSDSPTVLAQICRYWRSIAIAHPPIWSSMMTRRTSQSSLQRVRLWLIRSGTTRPLYLGIGLDYNPSDPRIMNDIVSLFISHRHRWQKISFVFPEAVSDAVELLARLPSQAAPQLQQMLLECACSFKLQDQVWAALGSSRNLHSIHVEDRTPTSVPSFLWQQLTLLSLQQVDPQLILDNLGRCQQLEELHIALPFDNARHHFNRTQITLPVLKRFTIHVVLILGSFLDCLTTPSLVELTISQALCADFFGSPHHFHKLIERSKCSLEMLRLSGDTDVMFNESQYLRYFDSSLLPDLKTASLHGRLTSSAIQAFAFKENKDEGDSGGYLPMLENLSLGIFESLKSELLEEMIRSRASGGQLKSVKLVITGDPPAEQFMADMRDRPRGGSLHSGRTDAGPKYIHYVHIMITSALYDIYYRYH
ncbi:hypothetical protein AX16_004332 [Volvariella volvacea WC 439]|nr:hypothetical protein AX16_004332 [Volvariella volvacea WC 439]